MQDLGKITIDVTESPGEGGIAAAGGGDRTGGFSMGAVLGQTGSAIAGAIMPALAVAKEAFGMLVGAVRKAIDGLVAMHRFIMDFADDIREFSPAIQLADMQNEIEAVRTKMGLAAGTGAAIGSQILQAGRIERSILQIRGFVAGIGAVFLAPITKMIADLLEWLQKFLPRVIEAIAAILDGIGNFIGTILPGSGVAKLLGVSDVTLRNVAQTFYQMAADIRSIKQNTSPMQNYTALNQPFIDDLRLMGARI